MRLLILLLLLLLISGATARAGQGAQALFDAAAKLEDAGEAGRAAETYYQALEALRADGRGESADAGIVGAALARTLAAVDHPRTDGAYRFALAQLRRAADLAPYVATAEDFVIRLVGARRFDDAAAVVEEMLSATERDGTAAALRLAAVDAGVAVYGAAERKADTDRVIGRAEGLAVAGPHGAELSGLARLGRAQRAEAAGRRGEARPALDDAVADFRAAGEPGREMLPTALLMRGEMALGDGDYRVALDSLTEALPGLSGPDASAETRALAEAMRIRLLLRFERLDEALRASDAAIAAAEARGGTDGAAAVGLRLDRVEILLAARRRDEAAAALDAEARRLGGKAEPVVAGFYFERLAAVLRADERWAEALEAADEAIRIRRRTGQPEALLLEPMRIRADVSTGIPDVDAAERAHRDLVELSRSLFPPTHPELARDLNALAIFLSSQGDLAEAAAILRRVAEMLAAAYGEDSAKHAYALQNLAIARMFDGGAEEAVSLLERAIAITDRLPETGDFAVIARLNLASALAELARPDDVLEVVAAARARGADAVPRTRSMAAAFEMQAAAGLGRLPEAMEAGRRMLSAESITTYEDAHNALVGLARFAAVALKAGRSDDALGLAREAMARSVALGLSGGGPFRESAAALVGAAWAVAAAR